MEDTFMVNDNGVMKEAQKITMLTILDKKYLIYSVKNDENTSLILASRVIKDENNNYKLLKIEEGEDKETIKKFIETLSV